MKCTSYFWLKIFKIKSCFKVKIKPLHDSEDLEYSAKGIRTLLSFFFSVWQPAVWEWAAFTLFKTSHFVCNSRKILIIEVCNGMRVNNCSINLRRLWCHTQFQLPLSCSQRLIWCFITTSRHDVSRSLCLSLYVWPYLKWVGSQTEAELSFLFFSKSLIPVLSGYLMSDCFFSKNFWECYFCHCHKWIEWTETRARVSCLSACTRVSSTLASNISPSISLISCPSRQSLMTRQIMEFTGIHFHTITSIFSNILFNFPFQPLYFFFSFTFQFLGNIAYFVFSFTTTKN